MHSPNAVEAAAVKGPTILVVDSPTTLDSGGLGSYPLTDERPGGNHAATHPPTAAGAAAAFGIQRQMSGTGTGVSATSGTLGHGQTATVTDPDTDTVTDTGSATVTANRPGQERTGITDWAAGVARAVFFAFSCEELPASLVSARCGDCPYWSVASSWVAASSVTISAPRIWPRTSPPPPRTTRTSRRPSTRTSP